MAFTERFIDSLINVEQKDSAKAFNALPVRSHLKKGAESIPTPHGDVDKIPVEGLYGCLMSANARLKDGAVFSNAFEGAIFSGVIGPVFSLCEDLEKNGDLTADSIPKLRAAQASMSASLRRYEADFKKDPDIYITQLTAKQDNYIINKRKELAEAEIILQQCKDEVVELSKEQPVDKNLLNFAKGALAGQEKKILLLNDVISKLQKEKLEQNFDVLKSEFINSRKIEPEILKVYFQDVSKELNLIERRIKALQRKHEICNQYNANDKKTIEKRNEELCKIYENEPALRYVISDFSEEIRDVEKNGGKLIIPTSQGKSAAMGNSQGLCAGYAAQFLSICSSPDWDDLSVKDKESRFLKHVNREETTLVGVSDINRNYLYMTLESGLLWENQAMFSSNDTNIVNIKAENNMVSYDAVLSELYKHLDQHSNESKRFYIAARSDDGGHALALSCEKNGGFIFHDSNIGVVHCNNRDEFSKFFTNHMQSNYSNLNKGCLFYDSDTMKANRDYEKCNGFQKFSEDRQKEQRTMQAVGGRIDRMQLLSGWTGGVVESQGLKRDKEIYKNILANMGQGDIVSPQGQNPKTGGNRPMLTGWNKERNSNKSTENANIKEAEMPPKNPGKKR